MDGLDRVPYSTIQFVANILPPRLVALYTLALSIRANPIDVYRHL